MLGVSSMYLKIKIHPSSKRDSVEKKADDSFEVFVRAKPVEGKANDSMLELLSDFLKVPRSRLRLVKGGMTRNKIVERLE